MLSGHAYCPHETSRSRELLYLSCSYFICKNYITDVKLSEFSDTEREIFLSFDTA